MARPRGFMHHWTPKPHVASLIGQVNEIIDGSDLREIVRDECELFIDEAAHEGCLALEREISAELTAKFKDLI